MWGPLVCPRSVPDQNFQSCCPSASHTTVPRKHTGVKRHQSRDQEAYVQAKLSPHRVTLHRRLCPPAPCPLSSI